MRNVNRWAIVASTFLFIGMTILFVNPSFAPPATPNPAIPVLRDRLILIDRWVDVTINVNEPAGGLLGVMGDLPILMQKKVLTGTDNVLFWAPPYVDMTAIVVSDPGVSEVRRITARLLRSYIPEIASGASTDVARTLRQREYKFIWGGTPLILTMPRTATSITRTWTLSF